MKLGRTFFSLFLLIVFSLLTIIWFLDQAWHIYLEQDLDSYTGHKVALSVVEERLLELPEEQWPDEIARLNEKFQVNLSMRLMPTIKKLTKDDQDNLAKGKTYIYLNGDDVMIHHLVSQTEQVLILGPMKIPTRPELATLGRILILVMFGLLIFFWLWPMSRDLDALDKAAREIANSNFDVQAPKAMTSAIEPLTKTFNMMAVRLKNLINAHKELTSAVAHELRTPLARSRFALQMLESASDEEKRSKYIHQIDSDNKELDELINELLIYSTLESDRPQLKFTDYKLIDVVNSHLEKYEQYHGSIEVNNHVGNLHVECDKHFIDRALANYINNAIKYGDDQIVINLSQEGEEVIIDVEDNGKGVDDEIKPTVFEAFTRADKSRNKDKGGFGLGLAIVERIMQWHQGQVAVDDSELGGAKFRLKFPIVQ
ncbi:ATP-binding protein [Thalassotalea sp. LPB0316]|uniref:ATP-binding protein n=1 Tax=Thalassotalea sp. LPB0316 TaxID=2769490 RepID=UPI001868F1E3|nr:ATP-binding protein [Thalassotalea sp. LPB0316]QOL25164.1 ATP-binding protein [Thalassotalea sp. LPB0316]